MNAEARKREGTDNENRERFLARFQLKITPQELKTLERAYKQAKYGHRLQVRTTGARYFEHLRASALILVDEVGITDFQLIISCLLHDVVEDSFLLTAEDIEAIFGGRVAHVVETVTMPKKGDPRFASEEEAKRWYHDRLRRADNDVLIVKLADRLQNVRTLGHCKLDKQRRKAQETRLVYLPLAKRLARSLPEVGNFFSLQLELALNHLGL